MICNVVTCIVTGGTEDKISVLSSFGNFGKTLAKEIEPSIRQMHFCDKRECTNFLGRNYPFLFLIHCLVKNKIM